MVSDISVKLLDLYKIVTRTHEFILPRGTIGTEGTWTHSSYTPVIHHLDSFTAKQSNAPIIMVAKNFSLETIFPK